MTVILNDNDQYFYNKMNDQEPTGSAQNMLGTVPAILKITY